jgi:outer membrane protein assembly factor BamB
LKFEIDEKENRLFPANEGNKPFTWRVSFGMNDTSNKNSTLQKPLRVWPGVVIAIIILLLRFGLDHPQAMFIRWIGGLAGSLAIILWWLFFSRAPLIERVGAILLMIAGLFATSQFVHISIRGFIFCILAIPVVSLALVAWAVATRDLSNRVRRITMVATILLACGVWTLIRNNGVTGEFDTELAWRWSETPEERLLAQSKDEVVELPPAPAQTKPPDKKILPQVADQAKKVTEDKPTGKQPTTTIATPTSAPAKVVSEVSEAEWPGFRGPERNGIVHGVRINTDWSASPPVELWRRPIGPGWSSFAVDGDRFYTQEQRGDYEVVSCYNLKSGKPVWRHRDAARFWEPAAGAGPRSTPTIHNGRVYALGATGIMNALNASDGSVIWSRNAASDTGAKLPNWGFTSSPLVIDNIVIVATSGSLVAYNVATGNPQWFGPKNHHGYSSPLKLTIDGIPQVLLMSSSGLTSVDPSNGKVLWENLFKPSNGIIQPALVADGEILVAEGDMPPTGIRRISVDRGHTAWRVKERWKSIGLKPHFNDFVIHKGYAFGFDGSFLSCIDLQNGERKWKGGRYGHGQMLLLADQDLLLVLSEKGEVALVNATSDQFSEIAQFKAIEGKTWNHPVVVRNVLLVRNGEEMAAFRLSNVTEK